MANRNNKVIYIGVTNDINRRVYEHKCGLIDGFTSKYKVDRLIYTENYQDIKEAISREKQLKNWRRDKKNKLIENVNPDWKELQLQ